MKKTVIWIIAAAVVIGLGVGAYFIWFADDGYIGKDAAKAAALEDAGCAASEVTRLKADLEHEDGYVFYEVEFTCGAVEYEYAINASTGAVENVSAESVYD